MRKSGLTGDEAYVLSKHGKTTEDLGPLKKELSLLKGDMINKRDKRDILSNEFKTIESILSLDSNLQESDIKDCDFFGDTFANIEVLDGKYYSENFTEEINPPYYIFHIDCGRKFFKVNIIKEIISEIAKAGFNQIQLHFSENIGFRLGLDDMVVEDEDGKTYDLTPCLGGAESSNKWYSQSDMDSIIDCARDNNIDVVPSFDMPGHMDRILLSFPQFAYPSTGNLDITNKSAVKFAKAILDKYCKYFSSRGCHFWNIAYDEVAYDVDAKKKICFLNELVDIVKSYNMIPRMYNDIVLYNRDYNYCVNKDIEIYHYYNLSNVNVNDLQNAGYKLINSTWDYYFILDKMSPGGLINTLNRTRLLNDFYKYSSNWKAYGAVLSIWCDDADSCPSAGDGGESALETIVQLIKAFGGAIERANNEMNRIGG